MSDEQVSYDCTSEGMIWRLCWVCKVGEHARASVHEDDRDNE